MSAVADPVAAWDLAHAELSIRRLANRHKCGGRCARKEHRRDVEAMAVVLAAMGILDPVSTYNLDLVTLDPVGNQQYW